jgi:type II secretory ATPase GspE/PulE/Tfp pilus assembly ATPase PilB-like protein
LLTGHLVFPTLHMNSAPESISRLLDMGMDPFNFADALLGILAQCLAKKLCDYKEAYFPKQPEIRAFIAEYADDLRHTETWKADLTGEMQKLHDDWLADYGEAVDGAYIGRSGATSATRAATRVCRAA